MAGRSESSTQKHDDRRGGSPRRSWRWWGVLTLLCLWISPGALAETIDLRGPFEPDGEEAVERLRDAISRSLVEQGHTVLDGPAGAEEGPLPEGGVAVVGSGRVEQNRIVVELCRVTGEGRSDGVRRSFARYGTVLPEDLLALTVDLGFAPPPAQEVYLRAVVAAEAEAFDLFRASAAADPNWVWPRIRLARIHRRAGRMGEARSAATRALEIDPGCGEVYNELGLLDYLEGRKESAEAIFARGIERAPLYSQNYLNLSVVLRQRVEMERALPLAEKAIEIRPDSPQAWHNLASCHYTEGRYEASLEGYEKSIELAPDFLAARVMLGTALFHLERWEGSEKAFRELLDRRADDAAAHFHLGQILERRLETCEEALEHYRAYLEIEGEDVRVRRWIQQILTRLGR